jgi:hypothetical protein
MRAIGSKAEKSGVVWSLRKVNFQIRSLFEHNSRTLNRAADEIESAVNVAETMMRNSRYGCEPVPEAKQAR